MQNNLTKNKMNKNLYIYTLIFLAFCMGVIEVLLNLQGKEVLESTQSAWATVFVILSILWAYYDADKSDFEKPFDFGFLVYIFWPIAFPWYLVKTRGVEGLLLFFGFISLWLSPWLFGLVTYVYFT